MAINEVALGIQRILEGLESDEASREQVEVSFITYESMSDEIRIVQEPVPISQAAIPSLAVTTCAIEYLWRYAVDVGQEECCMARLFYEMQF